MSKDSFELFWLELLDQGIEKDNSPETAKPSKECIGMRRTFATIHHVNRGSLETCTLTKGK